MMLPSKAYDPADRVQTGVAVGDSDAVAVVAHPDLGVLVGSDPVRLHGVIARVVDRNAILIVVGDHVAGAKTSNGIGR